MKKRLTLFLFITLAVLLSIGITLSVSLSSPTSGGLQFNNTTSHNGMAKFFRGQTILVYANWTENITSDIALNITNSNTNVISIVSDTTSGDILNQTYNSTWTNYTIAVNTSSVWALGPHNVTINVTNATGQSASASANFTLWGWAEVNESANSSSVPTTGKGSYYTRLKCRVRDSNTTDPIENYMMNYYDINDSYSHNLTTLSDGWAINGVTWTSPGLKEIKCNITDNSTLYYNASSNNSKRFNISVWNAIWSTSGEFAVTPSISLNWTNNFRSNFTIAIGDGETSKINIDNLTTGISGNYSQYDFFAQEGNKYSGKVNSGKCFIPDDTDYNNPFVVKNSTEAYKNTTNLMSGVVGFPGPQADFKLIQKVVCPPGRYWGTLELRNATNHTEALNISVEIDVPISTENELGNTTGIGFFNGTIPVNTSTYHSYYFNTSNSSVVPSIANATGIRIELNNLARDLDLFLLDSNGSLKAKSINKGSNSESLIYNYLPKGEMWEIRVYGNHTQSTNYGGVIHFTTLNATNSSDGSTLSNVDFGDMWPGNQTRLNVTLKNEGGLNFTNLQETPELYHREIFGGASAPRNFTFLVPSSATKVETLINWTGPSDYKISLYKPDGTLAGNSSDKKEIANVTGVVQEEWVESSVSSGDKGFWKVGITNETNVGFNSYNVTAKVWFNADEWISSNFTNQDFKELGMSNDSQSYHFNFTVQNNSLAGKYKGWLEYTSDSGASLRIPLEFNLTAPEMVVETSWEVGEGSVMVVDNIGFNRSGANKLQIVRMINNTGNKNLTFDQDSNSTFLNDSSDNYMDFTYSYPEYINPGDYGNLTINITINTTKTNNNPGLYKGWILLNASEAQPESTFNLTVQVNLTDKLDVSWTSDGGDGLKTADGNDNWIENVSRDENITLYANVYYKNGSSLGSDVLKWNNFSAWITERNTSHNVSSGINIYNDSSGGDVWDSGKNAYDPNVSIPVNSQSIPGGYYKVYLKADHYIHGVHLYGTGVHNYLVINDTGLKLSPITDKSFSFNEGDSAEYMNISVVNYGPLKSTGKLYMDTWSYATIEAYDVKPDVCGGFSSGNNYFSLDVDGNASENCEFIWKITPNSDVSQDRSTSSLKIYSTDSNFGNITSISISVSDVTTTTTTKAGAETTTTTTTIPEKVAAISLSLEPKELEITQGNWSKVKVKVNNTGNKTLDNLKLSLSGIPSTWFSTSPSEIDDLDEDEEKTFTVNISTSSTSPIKEYEIEYKVSNDDTSKTIKGKLKILPSSEKKKAINQTYYNYSTQYYNLTKELDRLKEAGYNTSDLNKTLSDLKDKLQEANESIEAEDYFTAYQKLNEAKNLIQEAGSEISELEKEPKAGIPLGILVVSAIILIIVGSFFAYMLMPPKEGYHPEKGYEYKPPKKETLLDQTIENLKANFKLLKKKLGLTPKQKYDYTRRKKWKKKEEE